MVPGCRVWSLACTAQGLKGDVCLHACMCIGVSRESR